MKKQYQRPACKTHRMSPVTMLEKSNVKPPYENTEAIEVDTDDDIIIYDPWDVK
jgi:hypothetical protein